MFICESLEWDDRGVAFPCPVAVGAVDVGKGGDLISILVEVLAGADIIFGGGGGGVLVLSADRILLAVP